MRRYDSMWAEPGRDGIHPFDTFLDLVRSRLQAADGPMETPPGVIHAAVALLLKRRTEEASEGEGVDGPASAEVLIIKRARRAGDPWSGHLALPGGHAEPGDETLLAAALRETAEEVGIDARQGGRVLGRLPTISPMSVRLPPIAVTPFVVSIASDAALHPQQGEVDEAFWMPLSVLRNAGPSAVVRRVIKDDVRQWPAYPSPHGPIWGITERILSGFLALIG